jgi:hypothetical protein
VRIGSDFAHKAMQQKLRQEWDQLTFQLEEDIVNFALFLSDLAADDVVQRR